MTKENKGVMQSYLIIVFTVMGLVIPFTVYSQSSKDIRRTSHPTPSAYEISDQNALANDLIEAISKPNIVSRIVGSSFTGVVSQASVFNTSLQEFPRSGSQYIILGNGSVSNISNVATEFSSVEVGGETIPGGSPDGFDAFDVATLSVTINLENLPVEEDPRLVFRYKFCSEEPPTYWGSPFQDYFTAFVKDSLGQVIENIALLPNGDTFTIDNARPYMNQVTGSSENPQPNYPTPNDVVFNACTGIHTTDFNLSDWEGQVITLEFQIGDVADEILDSGVFIDGLEIQMGSRPDFLVDRVEFNQASQSFENGGNLAASQLVSNTRFGTGVRVYIIGVDNDDNPQAVSGRLHLYKDGSPVEGSPFRPVPLRIKPVQNPSRTAVDSDEKPTETLQFYVPINATIEPGNYDFYVEVDPDNEVDERETGNNRFPSSGFSTVTYNERETLNVLLLKVTPVDGNGNVVNAFTTADEDKYIEQRRYAYRIFPRHVDFWFNEINWNLDATSGWLWWEENVGDLSTKNGRDELFSTILERMNSSSRNYHTVIAMLPCATDLYKNANGWGYIGNPGGIVRTCANSTLTHEIAHNWLPSESFSAPDEDHDPTDSGNDGFWVGPVMKLKLNKPNILNVGSDDPWVSPESYRALYENNALINSMSKSQLPKQIVASSHPSNAAHITGWFDEAGEIIVKPIITVEASTFTPNDPDGDYIIEFKDQNEVVVESFQFSPPLLYEHDIAPSPGPFSLTVPIPDNFETIEFRSVTAAKSISGSQLTDHVRTIPVSDNAPSVSIISPSGGEVVDGLLTLEWDGSDADGEEIFYTVQYSDDGINFETISTIIKTEAYVLDTSLLPGGVSSSVRVIATDGFNTSVVTSPEFEVSTKSPVPSIMSPSDPGIPLGAPASFEGEAFDLEDGEISPDQLIWSSDIDGVLGTGFGFSSTQLSAGTHTITLVASDSEGNTGHKSITYSVVNTTPDAPDNLVAQAGNQKIELQWSLSSGKHVNGYKVYWGTNAGIYGDDFDVQNATSHIMTNLENGVTYYVAVTAYDIIGKESNFSDEAEATPSIIPNLLAPKNEAGEVSLLPQFSWSGDDRANYYQLQVSGFSDFETPEIIVDKIEATSYQTVDSLAYSSTYYWRVRAVVDTVENEWSGAWSFTTESAPAGITSLVSPENDAQDVEILPSFIWNATEGVNTYRLQLAANSNFEVSEILVDSSGIDGTELIVVSELDENTKYFWRVGGINNSGAGEWSNSWSFTTGISTSIYRDETPVSYTLLQNYPNPFNPTTLIRYGLPEQSDVQLAVYNMLGQRVAILVAERKTAGWHSVQFNASNLSSGIYFYRINAINYSETKKLTVIK